MNSSWRNFVVLNPILLQNSIESITVPSHLENRRVEAVKVKNMETIPNHGRKKSTSHGNKRTKETITTTIIIFPIIVSIEQLLCQKVMIGATIQIAKVSTKFVIKIVVIVGWISNTFSACKHVKTCLNPFFQAVASAAAMSDRYCLYTWRNKYFSAKQITSCVYNGGG